MDYERDLDIHKVRYDVFEQCIKRFGFNKDIGLKALAVSENECLLKVAKIEDESSI